MAELLKNYINGSFEKPKGSNVQVIKSPVSGEELYKATDAIDEEVDAAANAASKAQKSWRDKTAWERADICHQIADAFEKNKEKLGKALTKEQGKPYESEAIPGIEETAENFRIAAEDVKRQETAIIPSMDKNKRIFTFREPHGVYACIIPWNFPTLMLSEFMAPAIAAGNTVIFKPSEWTPGILSLIAELFDQETDLPNGVFNLLYGAGDVGQKLVEHPQVEGIGFIGHYKTADIISRHAGVKPTILEASGNGPTIICEDADLEKAAKEVVEAGFYCAGQVCCSTARVIVNEKIHDEFSAKVVKEAEKWKLGDPNDPETTVGPMNNEPTAQKMQNHVEDAVKKGAKVLVGGKRDENYPTDLYFQPTVIDNVGTDTLIHQHETFGPIVPFISAKDDEEAIKIANDSYLGLQSAVYTKDSSRAFKFMNSLKTGNIVINENSNYWEPHCPFGGAAGTSTGKGRIGGRYTMLDMTELRTVTWDFSE